MSLIEHLVRIVVRKITRLLVGFIKILALLKISSKKLYFAVNFHPTANVTKNSILYVARVLDTALVKLSISTLNTLLLFLF